MIENRKIIYDIYKNLLLRDPKRKEYIMAIHLNNNKNLIKKIKLSPEYIRIYNIKKRINEKYKFILRREGNYRDINYYTSLILNRSIRINDLDTIFYNSTECKYLKLLEKLVIYHTKDFQKIRVGHNHDGGYIVLDCLFKIKKLYSYGIGDDIDFELEFYKLHKCPVYLYDHTVDCPAFYNNDFHPKKEGVSDKKEEHMNTIQNHIIENGDISNNNLFLKMDVEGAEWLVFYSINENILNLFQQIVIEIHWLQQIENLNIIDHVLQKFNKYFYLIHAHANNYAPVLIINKLKIPYVLELTYIRKDLVNDISLSKQNFPTVLDTPNNPNAPEIILDFYPFNPSSRIGTQKKID